MLIQALTIMVILSAALTIYAQYRGPRSMEYICKPLTTILILLIAVLTGGTSPGLYKYLIFGGLLFSLAGDVFLMLPKDRFIAGLISFLVAHLFYIAAFTQPAGFFFGPAPAAMLAVYGVIVYLLLQRNLGRMRLPVLAYMVVLLVMAWQAWGRYQALRTPTAWMGLLGAALFVLSDTLLALNRFRGKFAAGRALTLLTYFAAQWLIASSIA
jgi:uncharacterized membrane protein YhhN